MVRRRLPIGLQTFRKLREQDCYYVDKTHFIQRLLDEGTHYFLSRPRPMYVPRCCVVILECTAQFKAGFGRFGPQAGVNAEVVLVGHVQAEVP